MTKSNKKISKSRWLFLSYPLSENLSAYANGKRIKINHIRKISNGDSSNNTELCLPTHFGTHLDFPFHFDNRGKKSTDYEANFFIFQRVQIVDISAMLHNNNMIDINCFSAADLNSENELLLIYTGFCNFRTTEKYWNDNPSFHPDLAYYFKERMPRLRAIGFDTISLTGWKQRELGKDSHKSFLIDSEILIIEDMDLRQVDNKVKIKNVIVAPLRVSNLEGAPVTVIAEVTKIYDKR